MAQNQILVKAGAVLIVIEECHRCQRLQVWHAVYIGSSVTRADRPNHYSAINQAKTEIRVTNWSNPLVSGKDCLNRILGEQERVFRVSANNLTNIAKLIILPNTELGIRGK